MIKIFMRLLCVFASVMMLIFVIPEFINSNETFKVVIGFFLIVIIIFFNMLAFRKGGEK